MIRLATEADLVGILSVEASAFPGSAWSANQWLEELRGSDRGVFVAVSGAGGAAAVLGVASFVFRLDEAELYRVAVAPEARGRGVGTRLVQTGLDWARGQGAARVFLEVSEENVGAIRLYRAVGFVPTGRRQDYYGPGLAAVLMTLPSGDERDEGE